MLRQALGVLPYLPIATAFYWQYHRLFGVPQPVIPDRWYFDLFGPLLIAIFTPLSLAADEKVRLDGLLWAAGGSLVLITLSLYIVNYRSFDALKDPIGHRGWESSATWARLVLFLGYLVLAICASATFWAHR